jgi:hypothetical protein
MLHREKNGPKPIGGQNLSARLGGKNLSVDKTYQQDKTYGIGGHNQ